MKSLDWNNLNWFQLVRVHLDHFQKVPHHSSPMLEPSKQQSPTVQVHLNLNKLVSLPSCVLWLGDQYQWGERWGLDRAQKPSFEKPVARLECVWFIGKLAPLYTQWSSFVKFFQKVPFEELWDSEVGVYPGIFLSEPSFWKITECGLKLRL